MIRILAVPLTLFLLAAATAPPAAASDRAARKEEARQARLREKLTKIPDSAAVDVKLMTGEEIHGRLLARDENGIEVQSGDTRKLLYSEVKPIKLKGGGAGLDRRVWVTIAVVGGILAVAFATAASLE